MNSKLKLGVTIFLKSEDDSVWVNGITQNALFLARTLLNSQEKYEVFIINMSSVEITNKLGWDLNIYKTVHFNDVKDELDIIFSLGGGLLKQQMEYLKKRNCKIISYECGNKYIINMENVLFKKGDNTEKYFEVDEVWSIPQLLKTNKDYFRLLHRAEVKKVPFVWNNMFLDMHIKSLQERGYNPFYRPSNKKKKISVFEPNLNVVKYAMYPMLIAEDVHRENKELIERIYITNTQNIRHKKSFITLMKHFELVKEKKAFFENRFPITWFLTEHTDIVLSHQWENPLNYAYLDAVYLKYPLVHNAYMCKNCGYYYEGFNVKDGKEKLLYAIKEHDNNIEEYNEKNKKVLQKFNTDNKKNIEQYDKMIKKIINK